MTALRMTAQLQIRFLLSCLLLSCHQLALCKAENSEISITSDFLHSLAQNISCLHVTPCDAKLVEESCQNRRYRDDCHWRCTSSALDNGWASTANYDDCLLYANISQHLSALSNDGISRTLLDSDVLGVSNVDEQAAIVLATCMIDFYNLSPRRATNATDAACTIQNMFLDDGSVSADAVINCMATFCPHIVVNADIFGIGVYIASVFQIVMAFSFVITLFVLQILQSRQTSRRRVLSSTRSMPITTGFKIQKIDSRVNRMEKARRIMLQTTAKFQQAQCYYVIALTIATVYAIAPLGTRNLNELDQQMLDFIAGCNIFLTSVVLLMVLFADCASVSSFTFYLSFFTWLATLITSKFIYGAVPYYHAYRKTPGAHCANKTLLQVCKTDTKVDLRQPFMLTVVVIFLCFSTFYYQAVKKLWTNFSSIFEPFGPIFNVLGTLISRFTDLLQRMLRLLLGDSKSSIVMQNKWLILKLFTTVVACAVSLALWIDALATPDFRRAIRIEWTFGQVVALTIWLPVFFEFFCLLWEEFSEDRRHRIKQWIWPFSDKWRPSLRGDDFVMSYQGQDQVQQTQAHGLSTYHTSASISSSYTSHIGANPSPSGEEINLLSHPLSQHPPQVSFAMPKHLDSDYMTSQHY